MASHAAVGVDDDLAAGQTRVAHGAADLEPAGGVDQQPVAGVVDVEPSEDLIGNVLAYVWGEQLREVDVGGVLGGDHHGVDPAWAVLGVVLDADLGLAIGSQVVHGAVLAHSGQPCGQSVRHGDRQRHQLGSVVARVAEHQSLVARALHVERVGGAGAVLRGMVDPSGDVR